MASINKMKLHMTPRLPEPHSMYLDSTSLFLRSGESDPLVLGKTVEINTTFDLDRDVNRSVTVTEGSEPQEQGEGGSESTFLSPDMANLRIVSVQGSAETMDFSSERPPEASEGSTAVSEPSSIAGPPTTHGMEPVASDDSHVPEYNREVSVSSTPDNETQCEELFGPTASKSPRLDSELSGLRTEDQPQGSEGRLDVSQGQVNEGLPDPHHTPVNEGPPDPHHSPVTEESKLQRITKKPRRGRLKGRRRRRTRTPRTK